MNKKRIILVIGCILVAMLLATAAYVAYLMMNQKSNTTGERERDFSQLALDARGEKVEDNTDFAEITARYGSLNAQIQNEVRMSDPTKWDREMVEKTYFVIEVSRTMSEYPIIDTMLTMLAEAKEAGVDVDIESIGANQDYRDDMRRLTDDALSNPDYLPTDTVRGLK